MSHVAARTVLVSGDRVTPETVDAGERALCGTPALQAAAAAGAVAAAGDVGMVGWRGRAGVVAPST